MTGRRRTIAIAFGAAITSCVIGWASHRTATSSPALTASPTVPVTLAARQLCMLDDERIDESSGVAASRRYPGYLWTHNDSGDTARLFLIATSGETVAEVGLQNATAVDWEDMAIAGTGQNAWVYAGDIGDNGSKRANIVIYRIREPKIDVKTLRQSLSVACEKMTLAYPDGAHDAETLIATNDGRLFIVTKNLSGHSTLFETPQPFANGTTQVLKEVDKYTFGADGDIFAWSGRLATGGDLSPDGSHLIVRTYTQAYEWTLPEGKPLETIWKTAPRIYNMPPTRQGESICYSVDGALLYSTSEKTPTPLFELTPQR